MLHPEVLLCCDFVFVWIYFLPSLLISFLTHWLFGRVLLNFGRVLSIHNLWIFQLFFCYWVLVPYLCSQKKCLLRFQSDMAVFLAWVLCQWDYTHTASRRDWSPAIGSVENLRMDRVQWPYLHGILDHGWEGWTFGRPFWQELHVISFGKYYSKTDNRQNMLSSFLNLFFCLLFLWPLLFLSETFALVSFPWSLLSTSAKPTCYSKWFHLTLLSSSC